MVLGALTGLGLCATLLSDLPVRWLAVEDPLVPVDAAVVLAGDPDYERTTAAAALILSGQARLLILTGGEPGPGDSAFSLRQRALSLGVPAEAIRMETTSHSTREEVLAVAPLLEAAGAHRVALVTSPYHQRRAFLAARRAWPGIEIRNRPAASSRWPPRRWWSLASSRRLVLSEYAKLAYYAAHGWI